MSPLIVSFIVLGCISCGAAAGMALGRTLAKDHLVADSKEVLKMAMGLIATLSALVLGLLVAATKGGYDAQAGAVREMAADILLLDRIMAIYGPESKDARGILRSAAVTMSAQLDATAAPTIVPAGGTRSILEDFYNRVGILSPHNDSQRALKERAMTLVSELGQTRIRMITRGPGSIPVPFLIVLVFWLTFLFLGYGLLAPRNATVVVVLAISAVSVAGALFLILELDHPLGGIMRVPTTPLREAVSLLDG